VSTAQVIGTLGGLFAVLNERDTLPAGQSPTTTGLSDRGRERES
jgi:hypothetical protein